MCRKPYEQQIARSCEPQRESGKASSVDSAHLLCRADFVSDYVAFGNFTNREGHFIDTMHFALVLRQFPSPAERAGSRGKAVYSVTGVVVEEFDCISIEVEQMERLAVVEDARYREVV